MAAKQGPGGATRKGRSTGRATSRAVAAPTSTVTGRYTPPVPRTQKVSPVWMGPLILAFLILGAMMIVLNYFDVLPAAPTNWYLLGGVALIATGFITATQYR
jgi:hypothetical protein